MKINIISSSQLKLFAITLLSTVTFISCENEIHDNLMEQDRQNLFLSDSTQIHTSVEELLPEVSKKIGQQYNEKILRFNNDKTTYNINRLSKSQIWNPDLRKTNGIDTTKVNFIRRIMLVKMNSTSFCDFEEKLISVVLEIKFLPRNEQEFAYNITSIFYYNQLALEESPDDYGCSTVPMMPPACSGGCSIQEFVAWAITIAIAEPTPIGEVIIFAALSAVVVYGAITRYECIAEFVRCVEASNAPYYSPPYHPDYCSHCLEYCLAQGDWDCNY